MTLETLSFSQPLLEAVLGSLREGILVLDRETRVILYNRAAVDIFKIREGTPEHPVRLVDVTRNKTIHQGFRQVLDEGTAFLGEVEFLNSNDRTFTFRVTPLVIGEEVTGAIGVLFDITQLVQLERVRREFFSNLSHELRTPLTSILVYVETLLNGALYDTENNVQFLEIVNKHAKRMLNLVNDIRDLSAIEGGEIEIVPFEVDVKNFVDNLTPLLAPDLETQQVTFTNRTPPGMTVFADPKSLEQILVNLIINAVKFNRPGGTVTVDAVYLDDGHTSVVIEDTGIGIDAHHLPRIFERLYRVDKSRSQEVGGTGLGLAIVKHLVIANQGEITVESVPNTGSTFRVRLPRRP